MRRIIDLKKANECILCKTISQCDKIESLMHDAGLQWCIKKPYLNHTIFDKKEELEGNCEILYFPCNGTWGKTNWNSIGKNHIKYLASEFYDPIIDFKNLCVSNIKNIEVYKHDLNINKEIDLSYFTDTDSIHCGKFEDLVEIANYLYNKGKTWKAGGSYKDLESLRDKYSKYDKEFTFYPSRNSYANLEYSKRKEDTLHTLEEIKTLKSAKSIINFIESIENIIKIQCHE